MRRAAAAAATASAHSTEDPNTGGGAEQSLPRAGAAAAGAAPPADETDGGHEEQSPPPPRVDVDLTGDDSDAESYRISSDEETEEEPGEEGGASDAEEEWDPDPKGEWCFCHRCRLPEPRVDAVRVMNGGPLKVFHSSLSLCVSRVVDALTGVYRILHVDCGSELSHIKKSYRRLVLQYHPDKTVNLKERERERLAGIFKKLVAAFEILSDGERRSKYDETGETGDAYSDAFAGD